MQNENRGLIQEKEQLELSIDKIINRVVQLYDKKVEEERAAEADERAAEERGYDERATIAEKRAKEAEERATMAEESAKAAEQKAQYCELKLSKQPSFQLGSLPPSPPASPPASNSGSYNDDDSDNYSVSGSSFTYTDALVKSNEAAQKTAKYMTEILNELRINHPELTAKEVIEKANKFATSYKESLQQGGRINRKTKRRQSRRSNQKTKRRQSRRINQKTKRRQSRRSNRKTFKRGGAPSTLDAAEASAAAEVLTKYRYIFGFLRFSVIKVFINRHNIEKLRTDLLINMSNYMRTTELVTLNNLNNESQLNNILIPTLANYKLANYSFTLHPTEKEKILKNRNKNNLIYDIVGDIEVLLKVLP